jgi:hypothetical protein
MDLDPLHSTALISWLFVCGPIALIAEDPGLGIDILHLHFFLGNIAFEFFCCYRYSEIWLQRRRTQQEQEHFLFSQISSMRPGPDNRCKKISKTNPSHRKSESRPHHHRHRSKPLAKVVMLAKMVATGLSPSFGGQNDQVYGKVIAVGGGSRQRPS